MADATSVGVLLAAILVRREDIDRMACRPGIRKTLISAVPDAKNSGVGVEELDLSKNTGIGGAPCQT